VSLAKQILVCSHDGNGHAVVDAEVNWALCLLGIAIICGFTLNQGTPTVNTVLLSNAYGVAVLAVMARCLLIVYVFAEDLGH